MTDYIVFVRHAESPHPRGTSDYDRPLSDKGQNDAERIAERLEELDRLPERVVSSSAKRAQETWEAMASAVDGDREVTWERSLYGADVDDICEVVWSVPEGVDELLLIGHNPGFSNAVTWLTGVQTKMPTGSAAIVDLEGANWQQAVQRQCGDFDEMIRPAALRNV